MLLDGIDRKLLESAMAAASDGDGNSLADMVGTMTDEERMYFTGYVAGYVEATRHLQSAGSIESYVSHRESENDPSESARMRQNRHDMPDMRFDNREDEENGR